MDLDWCVVCDRHIDTPGSLYCTEVCRWKDSSSYAFRNGTTTNTTATSAARSGRGNTRKPEPYRLRPATLQTIPNLAPLSLPLPLCARDVSPLALPSVSPFSGLPAALSTTAALTASSPRPSVTTTTTTTTASTFSACSSTTVSTASSPVLSPVNMTPLPFPLPSATVKQSLPPAAATLTRWAYQSAY